MSSLPMRNDDEKRAKLMEQIVMVGDLKKLSPQQRSEYYANVCESLGLNPLTKPFDYIELNGRLTLYAKKDATDQLRKIHNVSINISSRERIGDIYIVTAKARLPNGREDEATGAIPVHNLRFNDLANAIMKAETKAKRRVTLSICGLGILDESEFDTIQFSPDAFQSHKLQETYNRAVQAEKKAAAKKQAVEAVVEKKKQAENSVEKVEEGKGQEQDQAAQASAKAAPPVEADADVEDTHEDSKSADHELSESELGDYVVKCGRKFKGRRLNDIEPRNIREYLNWLVNYTQQKNQTLSGDFLEFYKQAKSYLAQIDQQSA